MSQTIDVIIPTYRPGKEFEKLLAMLKKQTQPVHRLIVINTERLKMPDHIRHAVLDFAPNTILRDISASEFDHAGTRRMAASLSDADCLLFMTDDAVPEDENLLAALCEGLSEPGVAAAYARQLPKADLSEAERFTRSFNYPEEGLTKSLSDLPKLGIKTYFASNACCAYNRSLYEAVGGFIETAVFNEDMIFMAQAMKNGYKVRYCADARVRHSHNYGALQQLHRNFDLGVSQSMHPEVFSGIRSEGEGIRLVKAQIRHLISCKKEWEIPKLVLDSGCKYLGYKLGRNYRKLPKWAVRRLLMNKQYISRL